MFLLPRPSLPLAIALLLWGPAPGWGQEPPADSPPEEIVVTASVEESVPEPPSPRTDVERRHDPAPGTAISPRGDVLTWALDFWEENNLDRTVVAVLGLVVVLMGVLVTERAKQAAARARAAGQEPPGGIFQRLAGMPRSVYLTGVLVMLVLGLALLAQGLHSDLIRARTEIQGLRAKFVAPRTELPSG